MPSHVSAKIVGPVEDQCSLYLRKTWNFAHRRIASEKLHGQITVAIQRSASGVEDVHLIAIVDDRLGLGIDDRQCQSIEGCSRYAASKPIDDLRPIDRCRSGGDRSAGDVDDRRQCLDQYCVIDD